MVSLAKVTESAIVVKRINRKNSMFIMRLNFTSLNIPGTATNTKEGFVRRAPGLLLEKENIVGTTTRLVTTVTVALKTLIPLADLLTEILPPTQELKAIRTFTVTDREQNTRFTVAIMATYEKPVIPGTRKHPILVSVFGWAIEQTVTIIDKIIKMGTTSPDICLMLPWILVKTTESAKIAKTRKYILVDRLSETKLEKQLLRVNLSLRLSIQVERQWTI